MSINFDPSCTTNKNFLGPSLVDVCVGSQFVLFMSLFNTLIRNNEKISGACERVKSVEEPDEVYDFIVVGGGAAGSVVAARLSEILKWKVLLLEAGPHEPAGAQVPAFASLLLQTEIAWNYMTTNESNACLSTNGSCAWPSGKNLGGNMAHNGMLYIRGNPTDYNNWADLGNEGWTWEEVEPYFLKSENNGEIGRVGRVHHATGGPLSVERFPYVSEFGQSIMDAAIEAGYGISDDLNGDTKTGFSRVQATVKNGVRRSSARAYLWPVRNRMNLHVSLNSTVTRVIIQNHRAVGVEYYKKGEVKSVYATREVILCAGVVESPHLLLLSGIGPREHLESVGVEVMENLSGVGENLHDHPSSVIPFTINDADVFENNWAVTAEYLSSQTGPLSGLGTTQISGFLASEKTAPDYPDFQIYLTGYIPNCAPGEIGALRSTGKRSMLLLSTYLHPKSRGRITLASKDPFQNPVIWANYLGDPNDVDSMVECIKMAVALINTNALSRYNFTMLNPFAPVCSDLEFQSDEYWACFARQSNYPLYHQGGSCKMGPASDPMAVVDPRLRVHGIEGLRIADNSIMPIVISGNTAAPAIMIGERVSDFIKEDWDQHQFGKKVCFNKQRNGKDRNGHIPK